MRRIDPVVLALVAVAVGVVVSRGRARGLLATAGLGTLVVTAGARAWGVDLEPVRVEGKGLTAGKLAGALEGAADVARRVVGAAAPDRPELPPQERDDGGRLRPPPGRVYEVD